MGIAFHEEAILIGAGFHFVGVDEEEARLRRFIVGREGGPFLSRGITRPAAAFDVGVEDELEGRLGAEFEGLAEGRVAAGLFVFGQGHGRSAGAEVFGQDGFHF